MQLPQKNGTHHDYMSCDCFSFTRCCTCQRRTEIVKTALPNLHEFNINI